MYKEEPQWQRAYKSKGLYALRCHKDPDLMLLEQDVGLRQVPGVLVSALQLLLQPAEPLLHVGQALVEQLGAVGVEQQPRLLLGGGLQFVPQLVELGQALRHDGLKLRLGLHQLLALLHPQKHTGRKM